MYSNRRWVDVGMNINWETTFAQREKVITLPNADNVCFETRK